MNPSTRRSRYSFDADADESPEGSANGDAENHHPPGKACPLVATSEERRLWMPWSALSDRARSETKFLAFEETTPSGSVLEWKVVPGSLGLPGPFDRQVFRACEWLALERRPNYPALLGNFGIRAREVCERICLSESLSVVPTVRTALLRLTQVEIRARWKGGPRPHPSLLAAPLRLLSWVDQSHDHLPKSRMLRYERQVRFDPSFAKSVMSGGTVPLHWELWTALKAPAEQRLFEILSHRFSRDPDGCAFSGPDLCRLIPLPLPRSIGSARGALDPIHERLTEVGFLESARWDGARIEFRPGRLVAAVRKRVLSARAISVRTPADVSGNGHSEFEKMERAS